MNETDIQLLEKEIGISLPSEFHNILGDKLQKESEFFVEFSPDEFVSTIDDDIQIKSDTYKYLRFIHADEIYSIVYDNYYNDDELFKSIPIEDLARVLNVSEESVKEIFTFGCYNFFYEMCTKRIEQFTDLVADRLGFNWFFGSSESYEIKFNECGNWYIFSI